MVLKVEAVERLVQFDTFKEFFQEIEILEVYSIATLVRNKIIMQIDL